MIDLRNLRIQRHNGRRLDVRQRRRGHDSRRLEQRRAVLLKHRLLVISAERILEHVLLRLLLYLLRLRRILCCRFLSGIGNHIFQLVKTVFQTVHLTGKLLHRI